jgi:low molecular weight protein-tyrosine phosphatase
MKKILMVCLGNICRSPMAEGILQDKIKKKGLKALVDSCGFEAFHEGDPPDNRAQEVLQKHGIDISKQRSRLFTIKDFDTFDLIYVMDANNYADVSMIARDESDMQKVDFIRNAVNPEKNHIVSDPYYFGKEGFVRVYQELDEATESICEQLAQ